MSALLAVLVAVPISLALLWLRATVLLLLAGWFLPPVWPGLALPSVGVAMGLLFLFAVVTHREREKKDERNPWVVLLESSLQSAATSGAAAVAGLLLRWVVR